MDKLPKGWVIKKLAEVSEIITGNTPPKNDSSYYDNGTIPFVKPPDLGRGVVNDTVERITEKGLNRSRLIPENSIMVCCIGSLGKIGIAGQSLITNQQINSIVFDFNIVQFKYGYYYALTLEKYMNETANKAVVAIINKSTFSKFKIQIPPLSEQNRIVSKLDALFANIDKSIGLVEENIKHTRALMASVLDAVFGNGNTALEDLCSISPKKSETKGLEDVEVSFLPMTDLKEHQINFEPKQIKKISEVYSGYTYFKDNDVLLAKVTPCFENGKAGIAHNLMNSIGFGSSEYHVIRPGKNILPEWIYYSIMTATFREEGVNNMTGSSGLKRVPASFVASWKIKNPPIAEQFKIIEQIKSIDIKLKKTISEQQSKLTYLKALKASLLDKAFKGEL